MRLTSFSSTIILHFPHFRWCPRTKYYKVWRLWNTHDTCIPPNLKYMIHQIQSVLYIDLHLEIDNGVGWKQNLCDRFSFSIVNIPLLCTNTTADRAYGVKIPKCLRYSKASVSDHDFIDTELLFTLELLNPDFRWWCINHSFVNVMDEFIDRYELFVDCYELVYIQSRPLCPWIWLAE